VSQNVTPGRRKKRGDLLGLVICSDDEPADAEDLGDVDMIIGPRYAVDKVGRDELIVLVFVRGR
jgi:hypothetical protein